MTDIPTIRIHPVDHDAVKAYYLARNMREGEHYRLIPGPERWVSFETPEQPYDRFSE